MNLFEMLDQNYIPCASLTREKLCNYLEGSATYNTPRIAVTGINSIQAAVLLAYAGNLDNVLSAEEYSKWSVIVAKAMQGWNGKIQKDPVTTKITNPFVKTGV